MIKISVYKQTNNIDKIVVNGHSGYGVNGNDIVCASVSSIVITTVNAMIRINENSIKYEEEDGFVSIEVINHDEVIDKLIINMLDLLEKLEKQYTKYVKINKEVSSC